MFGLTPFERSELWNPFRGFESDFFKTCTAPTHCRTDIRDEGDRFVLECEMPGFEKDAIQIDTNGSTLTLCASRQCDSGEQEGRDNYIRRERTCGSYCRSFDISGIDEGSIDAAYSNGILTLTLPKKEKQQPAVKRIAVR